MQPWLDQRIDNGWDFAKADIHYMTHGLHPYPARMIPQIAERLISKYSKAGDTVLDPFCGSGGVLVESMLAGRNSFGIDINPLACLMARVKSTPLDPQLLTDSWRKIHEEILTLKGSKQKVDANWLSGINIEYWFKESSVRDLAIIWSAIDTALIEGPVKEFFKVCFSNTVRLVSGTRKSEFKLYRVKKEEWDKYAPDAITTFAERTHSSISKMGAFHSAVRKRGGAFAKVIEGDSRDILTERFPECGKDLTEGSVDLIVTSPPYGDSKTTVAYGQFSRLSLAWLGYLKAQVLEVDKRSIGGRRNGSSISTETLDLTLNAIPDKKRAEEVRYFFVDLARVVERLDKVMKTGARACFVLGNRTVNSVKIPSDKILIEIASQVACLKEEAIFYRNIPSKRIPWKSSPTNEKGKKVETIGKESIVVLAKR